MDSDEIPLALVEKLQDLAPVGFGFLRTVQLRYGDRVRAQDLAYRHAGDAQHPRDLPFAHSLRRLGAGAAFEAIDLAPRGIQLAGFMRIAVALGEDRCHRLAI